MERKNNLSNIKALIRKSHHRLGYDIYIYHEYPNGDRVYYNPVALELDDTICDESHCLPYPTICLGEQTEFIDCFPEEEAANKKLILQKEQDKNSHIQSYDTKNN